MESDFRSMVMFRPSSSTCKFSSRVPNRVSMLGLISILFFIQLWRFSSRALDARIVPDDGFRCGVKHAIRTLPSCSIQTILLQEVELPWTLAPKAKATTIGFRVPPFLEGVNHECVSGWWLSLLLGLKTCILVNPWHPSRLSSSLSQKLAKN